MGKSGNNLNDVNPQVQQSLLSNSTALTNIASQQSQNAEQLYNLTEPGLVTAEDQYQKLASGDPAAIMQAIAPAAQQTAQATAGARANIMANDPSGGEKNLALEQTDVNRGAQISSAASGATLNAPNALGQLASQGISESTAATNSGISGLSNANQGISSLQGLEYQGEQISAQEKGSTLGALGSLAGAGASAYGSYAALALLAA
ncbi:MAG TPA: hypothetical protein VN861_03310 [Candidatus Acidoferrales bacterium]|nr:hypothetical protein [Candidatus Acidoferrales bacterium]